MVECARLESEYTERYQRFESSRLRSAKNSRREKASIRRVNPCLSAGRLSPPLRYTHICMIEIPHVDETIEHEKALRESRAALLEELPGFHRLSQDQQRYLRSTLYIQQRAERGTDPISSSRVQDVPEKFASRFADKKYIAHSDLSSTSDSSEVKRYLASQLKIMSDYCHKAVIQLEEYAVEKLPSSESLWCEVGPTTTYSDLEELVATLSAAHSFPFVIEVWDGSSGSGVRTPVHSSVLLGRNSEGKLMTWEKAGFHLPFQLVPLDQVYDIYKEFDAWRMRPLSV